MTDGEANGARRPQELLTAVRERDRAVWTAEAPNGAIALRNQAVRAAIAGGWTADEIAQHVKVTSADVRRWASAT